MRMCACEREREREERKHVCVSSIVQRSSTMLVIDYAAGGFSPGEKKTTLPQAQYR